MNDSELRIAIIDPVGKKAGMDVYDLSLAHQLKKLSCNVKVYSNFSEKNESDTVVEQFDFTFEKNLGQNIRFFFQFISGLQKAKKESTQVILLHLFHSTFADLFFIALSRFWRFKICLILHDVESFVYSHRKYLLKGCLNLASSIIVHNKTTYDELLEKIGYDKENIWIVPHGNFIGHPAKEKREFVLDYFNMDYTKKYLIFFGMIKKSKGLEVLLEALQRTDENIHLIIAGRMRDQSFRLLNEIIDKMGLTQRVHTYIRYITNVERHYFFSLADVAILPYLRIYQSGVLLLAMSYGIPVIASNLPANREIIDGQNGKLFISGDSRDLAVTINLLINDENARILLSKKSIDYVNKNHDWANISKKFMDILTTIK